MKEREQIEILYQHSECSRIIKRESQSFARIHSHLGSDLNLDHRHYRSATTNDPQSESTIHHPTLLPLVPQEQNQEPAPGSACTSCTRKYPATAPQYLPFHHEASRPPPHIRVSSLQSKDLVCLVWSIPNNHVLVAVIDSRNRSLSKRRRRRLLDLVWP